MRIIEDQQAAKRREHDRQQRMRNAELMEHVALLRHDLQSQWKAKHQALMVERQRVDAAKAADLKAKIDSAKYETKEHKQAFKEHFESASTMMRVIASTFAKLAAVENARDKTMRQGEMQVIGVRGGGCASLAHAAAGCSGSQEIQLARQGQGVQVNPDEIVVVAIFGDFRPQN